MSWNRRVRNSLSISWFFGCVLIAQVGGARAAPPVPTAGRARPVETAPAEQAAAPLYDDAVEALREGVPTVAMQKLRTYLAGQLPADGRRRALVMLVRAYLAAQRAEEALKVLDHQDLAEDVSCGLLRAQALAALGSWKNALEAYRAVIPKLEDPSVAQVGAAEVLHQLNRHDEAISALEAACASAPSKVELTLRLAEYCLSGRDFKKCRRLLDQVRPVSATDRKWQQYLEAQLLLALDQPAPALLAFQEVVRDQSGLTSNLLAGAALGVAEALAVLNGPDAADSVLEKFIWEQPENPQLALVFRKLNELYEREGNRYESTFVQWASTQPDACAALAHFYLIKAQLRAGRRDKATNTVNDFVKRFPDHPLCSSALVTQGELFLEDRNLAAAIRSFEEAMRRARNQDDVGRAELAAGVAHFHENEFVLAGNLFRSAADGSEKLWELATFDSALAWLNQRNDQRFLDDYRELSIRFPESDLRRELVLEEGLLRARTGDARAIRSLERFISDFPDHRRVPDAQLALAELAFVGETRDLSTASQYLRASLDGPQQGQSSDRAAYLAILVADSAASRDEEKVIESCRRFLRERPESKLDPEVRMKLGQIYFRREDFANAQTQFETLARATPGSALVEGALFLAGQSSMRSLSPDGFGRALDLFEEVAQLNGPLKLYARQEQAIAQSRMDKETEALILYDNILTSDPPPDLLFSVLAAKGDSFMALAKKDEKHLKQAIEVFTQLASLPNVTGPWRNQALYKKGKCLQKQDAPEEALTTFYDVLRHGSADGGDYFWYYKAGFDAAQMLEAQEQWKPAIAIYQKMANFGGPRAEEAKARANHLHLRYFIWEE